MPDGTFKNCIMLDFEEKNKSWLTSFLFRQELLKSCWLLQFLRFFLKMKSAILISLNIWQELCTTWCNSIPLPFTSFKRAIKQVITSLLCRGFFSILYIHLWWYFLSQSVSGMFSNIHLLYFQIEVLQFYPLSLETKVFHGDFLSSARYIIF